MKMTFGDAVRDAIFLEMQREEKVVLFGQAIEGAMNATDTKGLVHEFPDRVFDTPLSENGMAGMALGMALTGYRPIVHMTMSGFMLGGFEESIPVAAGWRITHGAKVSVPSVVMSQGGGGFGGGGEHAFFPTGLVAHFPGIKIAVPSNAADAKGLMAAAIRDDNPVAFFTHMRVAARRTSEVPEGEYVIPLGKANVARRGDAATIVASSRGTCLRSRRLKRLAVRALR